MSTSRDELASRLAVDLAHHLDRVPPPPADLPAVLRRGRRLRRRRTAVASSAAGVAVAVAVAVTATVGGLGRDSSSPGGPDLPRFSATGDISLEHGLRAYAMPGRELFMAGRAFPGATLDFLDTDAAATPAGVVTYDDGVPVLLEPSGRTVALDSGPADRLEGFHPTAKADAAAPLVAYALMVDGRVTVKVLDLERRRVVASSQAPCREGCSDTVIDGLDSGTVFVRDHEGTSTWDYVTNKWSPFAGARTRVADVRNRVVLYHGAPPDGRSGGWQYVRGEVDAQLSFDGSHVLSWSSVLEPTRPGGTVIRLGQGPEKPGYAFFTFDTDGSVLVALGPAHPGDDFPVYDCPLTGAPCDPLTPLHPGGGDPMFMGDDM